jgi:hypothetical protein
VARQQNQDLTPLSARTFEAFSKFSSTQFFKRVGAHPFSIDDVSDVVTVAEWSHVHEDS